MDGHLREALAREFPSHAAQNELATTLFLCAELKRDAGMMCRALALWEALCPAHPEYEHYAENPRRMLVKRTRPPKICKGVLRWTASA